MNDSISKGEIIHAVNAEVNKPKKVRYKLHTPIEEVVIEFDEKEEVTSIDHILSDSIKAWTGEDVGKTEPSDLISRAEALNALDRLCEELEEEVQDAKENPQNYTDKFVEQTEEQVVGITHAYHEVYDIPSADRPTEDYSDLPDIPRVYYEKIVGNMSHEINMLKEQLESADAVNVVRCKDCKHYIVEGITTQYGWCHEYKHSVNEDDYCSYGERQCNYFSERREP